MGNHYKPWGTNLPTSILVPKVLFGQSKNKMDIDGWFGGSPISGSLHVANDIHVQKTTSVQHWLSSGIKFGKLENPRSKWSFLMGNISIHGGMPIAKFDDWRVYVSCRLRVLIPTQESRPSWWQASKSTCFHLDLCRTSWCFVPRGCANSRDYPIFCTKLHTTILLRFIWPFGDSIRTDISEPPEQFVDHHFLGNLRLRCPSNLHIHQIAMHQSSKTMPFSSFNAQTWSDFEGSQSQHLMLFGFQKLTSGQVRATNPWRRTAWRTGVPKISKRPRDFRSAPGRFDVFCWACWWCHTQQLATWNQICPGLVVSILVIPNGTFRRQDTSSPIFAMWKEAIGSQVAIAHSRSSLQVASSCWNNHQFAWFKCVLRGIFIFWLVVWLPWISHFPIFILGISSSLNWRSHIFQRGGPGPPTSCCLLLFIFFICIRFQPSNLLIRHIRKI